MAVGYEHFNFSLRLPKDEYRRLKKIQSARLIKAIREKENESANISLHKIIMEGIAKVVE